MSDHSPSTLRYGSSACGCVFVRHKPRLVAVTGGPGAGKTAILELAARSFCRHVAVLPEAASIVFGGGFPRHETVSGRKAAQRAIYRVQREVERMVIEERDVSIALCDRGTIDGLAYWPGALDDFSEDVGFDIAEELHRYQAVIHLSTPTIDQGYAGDSIRVETAQQAVELDHQILLAWSGHPNRLVVDASSDFTTKALEALGLIRSQLPACCWSHELASPQGTGTTEQPHHPDINHR